MIIDIVLVIILLYLIYKGYNRGFIASVFGITSDIFCIVFSYFLLNRFDSLISWLSKYVSSVIKNNINVDFILNKVDVISTYISKLVLMCVLFIAVRLLLNFIKKMLNIPLKIECMSSLDKILGVIFNAFKYVVLCSVLSVFIKTLFIDNGIIIDSFIINKLFINNTLVSNISNHLHFLLKS